MSATLLSVIAKIKQRPLTLIKIMASTTCSTTGITSSNAVTLSRGAAPILTEVTLDTIEKPLSAMNGSSIPTDYAIITKGSATRFRA